jgi:hypothetical protein
MFGCPLANGYFELWLTLAMAMGRHNAVVEDYPKTWVLTWK